MHEFRKMEIGSMIVFRMLRNETKGAFFEKK